MNCKHCGDKIKECRCGLGHGFVHVTASRSEQLHRCWPVRGAQGAHGQARQSTFAEPR